MVRLPIERVDQSGEEAFFAFSSGAVTALPTPQPGIEQVSYRVAKHVEGVDGNRQGKTRPERKPWGHLHVLKPFPAEHPSPTGNLDGQSESEETQRRLGNDDAADVDREDDEEGRHNIGQHMADQDLAYRGAHGLGCQKIVILFDAHHGAADDSGATDASGNSQDQDDLGQTPPHDGHDGQQEQQSREGHPGIDKALRSQVHFPPQESGSTAYQDSDDHIQHGRCQTDH